MELFVSAACVAIIACAHVIFPYFDRKAETFAAIWVPATGGIAIGYVFLYLLPKMGDYTTNIANNSGGLTNSGIIGSISIV